MPASPTVMPRRVAVREVVAALADRTAFVVIPPPGRTADIARRLRRVAWTALLDNGHAVLRCTHAASVELGECLFTPGAVILVPKTVPADELGRALGSPLPDDGSQDLVFLQDRPGYTWPVLFLDALEEVDAPWAQAIWAEAVRTVAASGPAPAGEPQ